MNKKTNLLFLLFILLFTLNTIYADDNTTNEVTKETIQTENSQLLEENTPYTIDITQDNYQSYFTQDNELNQSQLKYNTQLNIYSIPSNTQEIGIYLDNEDINLTITGKNNLTLNNTGLIISSNIKNLKISNITFNYNESYEEYEFIYIETVNDNTENYLIENININCIQYKPFYAHDIHPLDINAKNLQVNNININAKLPSNTISFVGTDNKPYGIALNIVGENITLNNSHINLTEYDKEFHSKYNTIYAIYNEADKFTMTNTEIYIEGEEYVYAVVSRSSNNKIYNNNITSKSTVYSAGINIEGQRIKNNQITNNTINITAGYREQGTTPNGAEDSAYGLIVLDYSYYGGKYKPTSSSINNTTYTYNKIIGSAGNIYAIEIFGGTNTNLSNNYINITGRTPMGIGAIGENVSINNNNITCTGQTNNTEGSADYLKPRTVGIYTFLSSTGINIDNNTINTTNGRAIYIEQTNNTIITNNQAFTNQYDYTIEITGTNNSIIHNYLISRNHEADNSIKTIKNNTILNNTNTPLKTQTIITLPEIHGIINEKINITATITDTYNNPINTGYILFTDIAEIIQQEAPVTNGSATIIICFDEEIDTILFATYNPTDSEIKESQTANTLTITKKSTPTININTIQNNDNTLTIISTIQNTNNTINKGKVTFKVNGKTLKDANGKVIYAKVVNSVATIENYIVPSDWSKDGSTIEAIYSGSTQCEKLTSEKTNITVAKAVPTLTTDDVTATAGGKITLKATITDNDKVINTGKIVFKINGKTVKDENGKVIYAKVVNNKVEFEYTLPESYKAGSYNITATFISAYYDRLTDSKTLTVNA